MGPSKRLSLIIGTERLLIFCLARETIVVLGFFKIINIPEMDCQH